MSALIPFSFDAVPAYLQQTAASADALLSHAGKGFPIMSIKGKTFAIVRDGERAIVRNPKDPDSAASYIEIVIVKVNPNKSKVYYEGGYVEGADAKPACMSNDGIKPDARVDTPQCATCALCPKNQFGSKITDNGKKAKACQDSVRVAIAVPGKLDDPMLLRVPPASIGGLVDYGRLLKNNGVGPSGVITRLGFDMESPTPLLTFKPVGFMSQEDVATVTEVAHGDTVQNILGSADAEVEATPEPAVTVRQAAEPQEAPKITRPVKKVAQIEVIAAIQEAVVVENKPAAKPAEVAAVVNFDDIDMDNLNFD